jgi:tRNA pseudouridine32 synthase / 23S rRNA pseudouridine746 synthase
MRPDAVSAGPQSPIIRPARQSDRQVLTVRVTVPRDYPGHAPDLLATESGLSKIRIKDAMQKGAVWIIRGTRKAQRLKRATTRLRTGERLELYYDSEVLARIPPAVRLVDDRARFSVWDKPPGLLVEGSRFGDHATLAQQVANFFRPPRAVFLVHRLDLEASGLIVVAHSSQAAAKLSALFATRDIDKEYQIEVRGKFGLPHDRGTIDRPLDGKPCRTDYVIAAAQSADRTIVNVAMRTGRYHQIRRHFDLLGHPVMGDPKYGKNNADPRGLRLRATRLVFQDPWTQEARDYAVTEAP